MSVNTGNFGVLFDRPDYGDNRVQWFETEREALEVAEREAMIRIGNKVSLVRRTGYVAADVPTRVVQIQSQY